MEEQRIDFETAKLAKEKGFDWLSQYYYMDGRSYYAMIKNANKRIAKSCCSAPTQSLLQRWLREKYDIHVNARYSQTDRKYGYHLEYIRKGQKYHDFTRTTCDKSFEEALELGLKEALKEIDYKLTGKESKRA